MLSFQNGVWSVSCHVEVFLTPWFEQFWTKYSLQMKWCACKVLKDMEFYFHCMGVVKTTKTKPEKPVDLSAFNKYDVVEFVNRKPEAPGKFCLDSKIASGGNSHLPVRGIWGSHKRDVCHCQFSQRIGRLSRAHLELELVSALHVLSRPICIIFIRIIFVFIQNHNLDWKCRLKSAPDVYWDTNTKRSW